MCGGVWGTSVRSAILLCVACFRQHISVGAIVAIVGVVLAYHYAYTTDWRLLAWLFVVTAVASFLPDVDSDSSVPFYLVWGLVTVCVAGLVLYITIASGTHNIYELVGQPLVALLLMWFVVGAMVKRLTKHRGMFHSVPAACVVGLSMVLVVRGVGAGDAAAFLLGAGAGAGYLAHLVLDELHATVSIDGRLFSARRSLGSALKFFSRSRVVNVCTYVLLAVLVWAVSG